MPTVLEDYFDFSEPEEIRIQGHRIWLPHVLEEYLAGMTLEALSTRFDSLSKAEILACLLYYHQNQPAMDRYMAELREFFQKQREESHRQHGEWIDELRRRKAAMDSAAAAGRKESA
jgi:uncharacterized protein (DUF433 family)